MDEAGALAGRTARGPKEFENFFRQHFPSVARTMGLLARDPDLGQDLAQEAFTKLYERWERMESDEHARNFTLRTGVNLARSYYRRQRVARAFLRERRFQPGSPATEGSEQRAVVFAALDRLSPRQRACLVLVDYVGLDDLEVGRILGTAPSTVRVHVARARAAMRTLLEDLVMERDEP